MTLSVFNLNIGSVLRPAVCVMVFAFLTLPSVASAKSCVILLHGLARTSDSMNKVAEALHAAGFSSENVNYASRTATIEVLANQAIPEGLDRCKARKSTGINFVTHSLGGILVRQYLSQTSIEGLERVVMLAPPNQGSEVVDELKSLPGFDLVNGPAGDQLGVTENSVPRTLGAVDFDLGIIAGTSTFNPILSQFLPNPDDGKVSVESTRVAGMCGFLALPVTHTFIMRDDEVIRQTIKYLEEGEFDHPDSEVFDCEFMPD